MGETLIYYQDVPLNWKSLYRDAIISVAEWCHLSANEDDYAAAETILAKYNTRIHPRTEEHSADRIFSEILNQWGIPSRLLHGVEKVFFTYFQSKVSLYEDTIQVLEYFRSKGVVMGVLTDVPYGMPKDLVSRDIQLIDDLLAGVVTSVEVGWRKPDPRGFLYLADRLGVDKKDMMYVGNERKDVVGANTAGVYSVRIDRENSVEDYGEKLKISSLTQLISFMKQ